jgi:ribonuclease T
MLRRFRGFLPVAVDVETGGFDAARDALLEIAAVPIEIDSQGRLLPGESHSFHVRPFDGANIEAAALAVNGIDPHHPLRPALAEADALARVFREVRLALRRHECRRAILLGHNAAFDLGFLNAAVARSGIKRNPFHPFSSFDTATLAGAAFGQTVLAKAAKVAELEWDNTSAHSARYDAQRTAELFCRICNELRPVYLEADRRAQQLGWVEGVPEAAAAAGGAGAEGEATTPSPS